MSVSPLQSNHIMNERLEVVGACCAKRLNEPPIDSLLVTTSSRHPRIPRHPINNVEDHFPQSMINQEEPPLDWLLDSAIAVARLSKDFDQMFDADQSTENQLTDGPLKCCQTCSDEQCSVRLKTICLILSITTFFLLLLLALQAIVVQQAGLSILLVVQSLVFLFLIILQKKGLKPGTALGCAIAGVFVTAFSVLVIAIWARDLVLLLMDDGPSSEQQQRNHATLADAVEARLFPYPQPQLWGCLSNSRTQDLLLPVKIDNLSIGCITGQSVLGCLSIFCSFSSIGVIIVGTWLSIRAWREHRQLKNTTQVCPSRLQRTISTPLTLNMSRRSVDK